jgi:hypothetical protein
VEINDDWPLALDLRSNAPQRGALSPAGDVDWYRLKMKSAARLLTLRIHTEKESAASASIYQRGGLAPLKKIAAIPLGKGEKVILPYLRAEAGACFVKLSCGDAEAAYTLVVFPAAGSGKGREIELNNTQERANPIGIGGEILGKLDYSGDVDWYRLVAPADATRLGLDLSGPVSPRCKLTLFSTVGGAHQDTIKEVLLSPRGQTITFPVAPNEERYFLRILGAGKGGPYRIRLTR